jgi:hypothetical protein
MAQITSSRPKTVRGVGEIEALSVGLEAAIVAPGYRKRPPQERAPSRLSIVYPSDQIKTFESYNGPLEHGPRSLSTDSRALNDGHLHTPEIREAYSFDKQKVVD